MNSKIYIGVVQIKNMKMDEKYISQSLQKNKKFMIIRYSLPSISYVYYVESKPRKTYNISNFY
jgi:hypothetical protein